MKRNLSYEVAKGAMNLIADGTGSSSFANFGITPDEYDSLKSPLAWVAPDRPTIERVLNVITYGTMDTIGVARFPVSAEYIAAIVCTFVHPSNLQVACAWSGRAQSNDQLADRSPELAGDTATPSQLFALCLMIHSKGDVSEFKSRFERRTGLVEDAQE